MRAELRAREQGSEGRGVADRVEQEGGVGGGEGWGEVDGEGVGQGEGGGEEGVCCVVDLEGGGELVLLADMLDGSVARGGGAYAVKKGCFSDGGGAEDEEPELGGVVGRRWGRRGGVWRGGGRGGLGSTLRGGVFGGGVPAEDGFEVFGFFGGEDEGGDEGAAAGGFGGEGHGGWLVWG